MQRHPRGRNTRRVDRYDVCIEQAVLGKAVITLHTRIANAFLVFLLLVMCKIGLVYKNFLAGWALEPMLLLPMFA